MKNTYQILMLGTALLISLSLRAQNFTTSCGTPPSTITPMGSVTDRNTLTGPFVFQIFVHILRDNNGSNAAMTEVDMLNNIKAMATYFQPHNICFELVGWEYINNTGWNSNYNSNQIGALHAVNPHSASIDIYIHRLNFLSGTQVAGGNAYSIPSAKCSVSAQTPFNFAHEMGHCLGLSHTFYSENGEECPQLNLSNCGTVGDGVCDTPADFKDSQTFHPVNNFCVYNGTETIFCSGNTYTYNPPIDNIMSYWASCYQKFTPGQRDRMYQTITDNFFLQLRLAPATRTFSNATYTGEMPFGARQTITINNVQMTGSVRGIFNAGNLIQILPGTRIAPTGTKGIVLLINDLCTGVAMADDGGGDERASDPETGLRDTLSAGTLSVSPNPFTGSTTITYNLNGDQEVDLRIFNPVGQMVVHPVRQEYQDAGTHTYQFEAEGLAPGIYFLVMQTGNQKLTKRLVLAR